MVDRIMCGGVVAASVLWLVTGSLVAQQPQLRKWKTTDGYESEAAFYRVDEAKGTVTVLVPKTLPIERLDKESRQSLKDLMAQTKEPDPSAGEKAGRPQFALVQTLSNPTLDDWIAAAEEERVAIVGNWLFFLFRDQMTSEKLREEIVFMHQINPLALEACDVINDTIKITRELSEASGEPFDTSKTKVAEYLGPVVVEKGWVSQAIVDAMKKRMDTNAKANKKNVTTGYRVGSLEFFNFLLTEPFAGSHSVIGQVRNMSAEPIVIEFYNLNIYDDGKLVDLVTFSVSEIESGEIKSLSIDLPPNTVVPDLKTVTITPR